MKRFKWSLLVVLCLTVFGVGTFAHAAQTEVKLTAWTADQLYLDYFNSRLPEWEAAHPDIKFTYDFQKNSDTPNAVLQALAANQPIPDLVGIEEGSFPNYMKDGVISTYFADLSDLIPDPTEYAQGRLGIYTFDGKLYALESQLAASVFYYQPKIYADNGLSIPKTWEEMLADGDILGPKGISQTVVTNDGKLLQMFLNQRGGAIFDKDGKFVLGDDTNRPMAIDVATYIQKAVKNGTMLAVLGNDMWSGATIPTAYSTGKLAGTVMPDWWAGCCLKPSVADMSGQWSVAAPPVWAAGGHKTLTWGGTGWAVSSQSPNVEIAKQFIAFMYLGKESQVLKFVKINNFPWELDAFTDPRVTGYTDPFFGDAKIGEIYGEIGPDEPVWYQSIYRSSYNQAAADNLPALFDGTLTPEAFVDKVVKATQDAIDFGG